MSGNGFFFKKPNINVGSSSTTMEIGQLFGNAGRQEFSLFLIVCLLLVSFFL
jgi:hypothetical protein